MLVVQQEGWALRHYVQVWVRVLLRAQAARGPCVRLRPRQCVEGAPRQAERDCRRVTAHAYLMLNIPYFCSRWGSDVGGEELKRVGVTGRWENQ